MPPGNPLNGRSLVQRVLAASLVAGLAAWAIGGQAKSSSVRFICQSGQSFSVSYKPDRARVTTSTGAYDLRAKPSSIGRKFSSGDVWFIHDEDRAVLVGAQGGRTDIASRHGSRSGRGGTGVIPDLIRNP